MRGGRGAARAGLKLFRTSPYSGSNTAATEVMLEPATANDWRHLTTTCQGKRKPCWRRLWEAGVILLNSTD